MQLLNPYVLDKVAPMHNSSIKVEDLFHTAFVLLLALKAQNILKINRGKQFPDNSFVVLTSFRAVIRKV